MIKTVYYPGHILKHGITKNDAGIERLWNVASGDTETVNGPPNTMQLCFNGADPIICRVTPETIFDTFIFHVSQWARRGVANVIFFHNLKFDLQALLYRDDHKVLYGQEKRDFIVGIARKDGLPPGTIVDADNHKSLDKVYRSYLHVFADKTWFAKLKLSDRVRVRIIDSAAFFKTSLKSAAEMVKSPVLKLERPADSRCDFGRNIHVPGCRCLGKADLTGDKGFEEYIVNDVLAQYHVGNGIYKLHEEHDCRMSVSLPQLAARILRHQFFRPGDSIAFPPLAIARAFERSYHGGKNQMVLGDDGAYAAGFYKDVTEVDINSAYTAAMRDLPSFLKGEWKQVDCFVPGSHGVFRVDGEADCPYGVAFTHAFTRIEGPFRGIWMTSYEVESGLAHGCLKVSKCWGHIWIPGCDYSPFREFALHFWGEKARWTEIEGKKGLHTLMSKLFPNSTYGKLISSILDPDLGEVHVDRHKNLTVAKVFRAAGLYNPAIASLITGKVRGHYLHPHEHKWKAIHSSTDSIKTQMDVTGDPDIGKELGQWSVEVRGDCLLVRPKLYVHESATEDWVDPLTKQAKLNPETGVNFPKFKYAKHGFQGRLGELLKAADYWHDGAESPVLNGRDYDYFVTHCWSIRQALARRNKPVIPLDFTRVPMKLKSVLGKKPDIAVFKFK